MHLASLMQVWSAASTLMRNAKFRSQALTHHAIMAYERLNLLLKPVVFWLYPKLNEVS